MLVKSHHKLTQATDIIGYLKATLDRKQQLAGKKPKLRPSQPSQGLRVLRARHNSHWSSHQQPTQSTSIISGKGKEQDELKIQMTSFEQLIDLTQTKESKKNLSILQISKHLKALKRKKSGFL